MLKKILLGFVIVLLGSVALVDNSVLFRIAELSAVSEAPLPNFAKEEDVFNRQIIEQFPLPMATTELVAELRRKGFEIKGGHPSARYSASQFPCNLNWRVSWIDEGGQVVAIAGQFGSVCV